MNDKQLAMFSQGQDLPLFSQSPYTVPGPKHSDHNPTHLPGQQVMASCRICLDTGLVGDRFCWCAAGDAARNSTCPVA